MLPKIPSSFPSAAWVGVTNVGGKFRRFLIAAEQTLVSRLVVRDANALEGVAQHGNRFFLFPTHAAPKQHVHRGGENPRIARLFADFPACFVDVDDPLQSNQFGNRVVRLVPVGSRGSRLEASVA